MALLGAFKLHDFTALMYITQLNSTLPKTSVPQSCFTSLLKTLGVKGLHTLLLIHATYKTLYLRKRVSTTILFYSLYYVVGAEEEIFYYKT